MNMKKLKAALYTIAFFVAVGLFAAAMVKYPVYLGLALVFTMITAAAYNIYLLFLDMIS
jgi:uncharacterized membrane protein YccC